MLAADARRRKGDSFMDIHDWFPFFETGRNKFVHDKSFRSTVSLCFIGVRTEARGKRRSIVIESKNVSGLSLLVRDGSGLAHPRLEERGLSPIIIRALAVGLGGPPMDRNARRISSGCLEEERLVHKRIVVVVLLIKRVVELDA